MKALAVAFWLGVALVGVVSGWLWSASRRPTPTQPEDYWPGGAWKAGE